ncbi:MAG: hypothetical protein DHS20C05_19260 [Hyphococcus sp.]|nr:MAG: hypothetical protein DHS20C05_19260 [Marinicaulis sp.]
MMSARFIKVSIIAALSAFVAGGALAQTVDNYQHRKTDLVSLASIFGELHHIRRSCEPRFEGDIWRERMKKLIELEEPQPALREEMVASFNKGYRAAQQHFEYCERRARDHAAARAARGEAIIARLTAPLHEAMNEEENAPFIWQGDINELQ